MPPIHAENRPRNFQSIRLAFVSAFAAVRQVDFRWWGISSGAFWILSCAGGIAGSLNNTPRWNVFFAIGVSIFGILASVSGVLSVTGIWNLIRVRHRFFRYFVQRPDQQLDLQKKLGAVVEHRNGQTCLEIDFKTLMKNTNDIGQYFSFAKDKSSVYEFSVLNSLAYYSNVFGQNIRTKAERNGRIAGKNSSSQLMLRRSGREKHWAITALFPMTQAQWHSYISAKKSDNDFSEAWLLDDSHLSGLEVILVFSIGAISGIVGRRPFIDPYFGELAPGKLVLIGIFRHLGILAARSANKEFDFYVAANDEPVINVFKAFGFSQTLMSTGDDIPVFHVKIRKSGEGMSFL